MATISKELGISKAAVSLILNGKARQSGLSTQLEQRVLEYCREINYRPNIHAQRMNRRQVNNIGILLEEKVRQDEATPLGDYSVSNILGGIALAADKVGYRFAVQIFRSDMDESRVFDWFENREIDGLIYYGFGMPVHWRERFLQEKRHVVGISIDPAQGVPCVNVDNRTASMQLTEYLIGQGRRKMLFLCDDGKSYPGRERLQGFLSALEKHGLSGTGDFEPANFDAGMAEAVVRRRFASGINYDAVVCASDDMAVGALSALRDMKIDVPQQVAVTGADNIRMARFVTPALTTFDYLPVEQGTAAFELLHAMITGDNEKQDNILLNPGLIFRASA